ncbi:MAG TPA: LD-carboxypeptidase [Bacteroidota bacterium]|nr:LD-carboxypeptidase [Bacteroidota bacterium]
MHSGSFLLFSSYLRVAMPSILKPPRLQKGDLVALLSPASAPSSTEKIEKAVRYLESLGYRVQVGKHAAKVHGYLAGTDEERAADLNTMLHDPKVRAIFAVRGGYGTPRLLSRVDYRAVKRDPKIIAGYSDVTALQLALFRKTGLVTFSGPMAGVEMWEKIDPYTEENFWRVVTSPTRIGLLANPPEEPTQALRPGKATARLLGGNLSLLISLLGTPYAPNFKRSLLLLEEVDEAPHRVDRMFAHLMNARVLEKIKGLLLGKFTDCVPKDPSQPHFTTEEVLRQYAEKLRVPVLANVLYGHIPKKLTIPIGLKTRLDAGKGTIEVLENAVS